MPYFDIPLDLLHAGRIAERILTLLEKHTEEQAIDAPIVLEIAETLVSRLFRFVDEDENPPDAEGLLARDEIAQIARQLVDALEVSAIAGDRLGQLVRNLFECLELGEEGARISLRAGENPRSLQRPV